MRGEIEALRAIEAGPRVALPDEFAISPGVARAVREFMAFHLDRIERADYVCARCGQVVIPIERSGTEYTYTPEQTEGLTLAHLVQRHGWSREAAGE